MGYFQIFKYRFKFILPCYRVAFVQSYVDEFDYTVKNLSLDLRDGVRLARLLEILTGEFDLSSLLRVPAVDR